MSQSQEIKKGSKNTSKLVVVIVFIGIILLTAVGLFFWRNQQLQKQQDEAAQKLSQLETALNEAKSQTTTTPAAKPSSVQPKQVTLDSIAAAFSSKNTAALEGYMASKVHVVYAASEMAGDYTPVDAIKALDYVNANAVAPWDFMLNKTVIAKYGTGDYKAYFTATTLVGRASNGFVVAINFDGDGKINGIFASASDELL